MNDYVGCRISTEQSTHALAHRRALLSLREKSRRRNRKQSLEYLKEFGEPLQLFGSYKAEVYQGFFNRR